MTLSRNHLLFRSRSARFALALFAGLLTLVAVEFALRAFPEIAPRTALDIYRKDSGGNLLLRPGIERRHRTRHWDVSIRTDEGGFRTSALSGSADRAVVASVSAGSGDLELGASILVLGDSFAFGWGVEFEEAFPSLVDGELRRSDTARIINAAVPGTGPSDQLRLLKKLVPVEQPAVVVLAFFVGNDFSDVGLSGADQFRVEDGFLFRKGPAGEESQSSERFHRALVRRSRLLQALGPIYSRWFGSKDDSVSQRHWDEWLREFALIHLAAPPERTRPAIEQTLAVLAEIADYCGQRSSRLLLLILPRSYQVYEAELAAMRKALAVSPEELDLHKPQRVLKQWATRSGVDAVDILPSVRRHAALNPDSPLFYYPDAHLTAEGHALAADALLPALSSAVRESFLRNAWIDPRGSCLSGVSGLTRRELGGLVSFWIVE